MNHTLYGKTDIFSYNLNHNDVLDIRTLPPECLETKRQNKNKFAFLKKSRKTRRNKILR